LLAALPHDDATRLRSQLEPVFLAGEQVLYRPHDPMASVYFPTTSVSALLMRLREGVIGEVATVGNEGMLGLPVVWGTETMPLLALSLIPGHAERLSAERFREALSQGGMLQSILDRYTHSLLAQIAQAAVCNRLHTTQERCARWLLMAHDRMGSQPFALTQALIARVQGVRRGTINQVFRTFQQARFIHYTRGTITILDRAGLEGIVCECYEVIVREYRRLLG
jgi:CRP-like cAMP-binding protein